MFKTCQTAQSAQRQKLIEETFFNLLEKNRYDDITITKICQTIPMPRKSFYRYFDSKEDVLYALVLHTLISYDGFTKKDKTTVTNIKKELEQFYNFWLNKKHFLDVLHRNHLLQKILEISLEFPIFKLVGISKYLPNDDEWERKRILRFTIFGIISEVLDWYKEGFKTSIKDMINITTRIISKPLYQIGEKN